MSIKVDQMLHQVVPCATTPAALAVHGSGQSAAELRQAYRATVEQIRLPLDPEEVGRRRLNRPGETVTDQHFVDAVRAAVNLCSVTRGGPMVMWKGRLAELAWNRMADVPEIRVIKTSRALADLLRRQGITFWGSVPTLIGLLGGFGEDIYVSCQCDLSGSTLQTCLDAQIWDIPTLQGIEVMPIMRADCGWVEEPGFDEQTGLWVLPPGETKAGPAAQAALPPGLADQLAAIAAGGGFVGSLTELGELLGRAGHVMALLGAIRKIEPELAARDVICQPTRDSTGPTRRTTWVVKRASAAPGASARPEILP